MQSRHQSAPNTVIVEGEVIPPFSRMPPERAPDAGHRVACDDRGAMQLSIIVPTYNEAPNVAELVRRVADETRGIDAEIIFVDDSTDTTPDVVLEVAASASVPV